MIIQTGYLNLVNSHHKYVTGNGVNRIFNRMFDLSLKIDNDLDVELCNYINLKEDEKRLVFRNAKSFRC